MAKTKHGTKWHDWMLTTRQVGLLEKATEPAFNRTIKALCSAARVPHRTFYNWMQRDDAFQDAWQNVWKVTLERHLPGVSAAVVKKAQTGEVAAGRLVADLLNLIKQRHEVTGENGKSLIPPAPIVDKKALREIREIFGTAPVLNFKRNGGGNGNGDNES